MTNVNPSLAIPPAVIYALRVTAAQSASSLCKGMLTDKLIGTKNKKTRHNVAPLYKAMRKPTIIVENL